MKISRKSYNRLICKKANQGQSEHLTSSYQLPIASNSISLAVHKSNPGWLTIGGKPIYFRSRWERNYARYLEFLKQFNHIMDWQYEPKTFWFEGIKRGVVSYKPDFYVIESDTTYWVEVKGYMDSKSKTKLRRFRKYFPDENIIVVEEKWFNANKQFRGLIKGWE